ncbi:VanZ family protein [Flavobacterium sp. LB2P44]|uniref:VanZ family protein n=1 Tax=Flavobacterium sp. LB2P44 TaxID=3401713 RepID=UPI003AB09DFB
MLKQFYFWAAILWAGTIAFFCLVQLNNVPLGNVANLDKFVHAFFHFVLTMLCFLVLKSRSNAINGLKPLMVSFLFSVIFGIGIEIAQEMLTKTRHADVFDVLANLSGATLAAGVVILFGLNTKQR